MEQLKPALATKSICGQPGLYETVSKTKQANETVKSSCSQKLRQEDHDCEVSLGYTAGTGLETAILSKQNQTQLCGPSGLPNSAAPVGSQPLRVFPCETGVRIKHPPLWEVFRTEEMQEAG